MNRPIRKYKLTIFFFKGATGNGSMVGVVISSHGSSVLASVKSRVLYWVSSLSRVNLSFAAALINDGFPLGMTIPNEGSYGFVYTY